MTVHINQSLSGLTGQGLWASNSLQAVFLKAEPSYDPGLDPRLPKHTSLTTSANLLVTGNATVSDLSLVPQTTNTKAGYLRIGADVWTYNNVDHANSVLNGLANVTPSTYSYPVGTVVSILGIR